MKKMRVAAISCAALLLAANFALSGCSQSDDTVVLKIANWEEYIDLGGWGDDEAIDIENEYSGEYIFGENSVTDDFTNWFNSQDFGFKVKVEYSTFGTNEDLYNQLNLGDKYDLVCPSDYMIMKLLAEDKVEPFSDEFNDPDASEFNYYAQNVSKYIDQAEDSIFAVNGWSGYAACYMWGTTGLVYNPDAVENSADVAEWDILTNANYEKAVTVKDNVRDAYFAALSILYKDEIEKINADTSLTTAQKNQARSQILNSTDKDTIAKAEDILKDIKDNVYSFETDSGKSDMVTGKVVANFQWSGDAVYIMDQADEEDTELWYSVPEACTNLWFDGWVMLKSGIGGDANKKKAAEAFVNYISRPDIAVRNMYYIGYTSSIASPTVFDYFDWCYGAVTDPESEDYYELESLYLYDVSYFFGEDSYIYIDGASIQPEGAELNGEVIDGLPVYSGGTISLGRQAFTQYPTLDVIERSVIMLDFGDDLSAINAMWINVRCLDIKDINPGLIAGVCVAIVLIVVGICLYKFRYSIFYRKGKS